MAKSAKLANLVLSNKLVHSAKFVHKDIFKLANSKFGQNIVVPSVTAPNVTNVESHLSPIL